MNKIPQVMAHRGDLTSHEENTLPALEAALRAGITHVEFDIQINAAGDAVVLHDPNFERTHHRAATVFDSADQQTPRLPTLAEVLDLADRFPQAVLCVEVKHDSIEHWGMQRVIESLTPFAPQLKRHFIFSRSLEFLARVRSAGFGPVGVIMRDWSPAIREQMERFAPEMLIVNFERVPPGELLWPGPWQWAVYEVANREAALAWGERGADFVLSHQCVALHQQLQAVASV